MRPEGWEGEDAIFLSCKMTHDEMIDAIRRELGRELQVLEYDGDAEYLAWASWPWPSNMPTRDDPWLATYQPSITSPPVD
jgi:hypothetical protein